MRGTARRWLAGLPDIPLSRRAVRERFGIAEHVILGLGVERWDFTKGVIERCFALELLLEQNPRLRGQVTLLQITPTSRVDIQEYADMHRNVSKLVGEVNGRHGEAAWTPIRYPRASWDDRLRRKVSDAEIADGLECAA